MASAIVLPKGEDKQTTHAHLDVIGFATLAGSLACFLIPLTQGNRVGWDDPSIGGSFVASAVLMAAFIWQELHCKTPMLDLKLFEDRIFSVAVSLRALLGIGYYFAIFLLPLFTQDLLGWDATQSGAVLVPAGIVMGLLMPISGTLSDRIGARPLVLAGMIVAAYGTFLFGQLDMTWDAGRIAWFNTIRTGALGLLFTPLTAAALANVPRLRIGAASGILNTVWQVGGSVGIAVGETFLNTRVAQRYSDLVATAIPSSIPFENALHHLQGMLAARGMNPGAALAMMQQTLVQHATVRAYGDTFMLGGMTIAVAIPIALLLRNHVKKSPADGPPPRPR